MCLTMNKKSKQIEKPWSPIWFLRSTNAIAHTMISRPANCNRLNSFWALKPFIDTTEWDACLSSLRTLHRPFLPCICNCVYIHYCMTNWNKFKCEQIIAAAPKTKKKTLLNSGRYGFMYVLESRIRLRQTQSIRSLTNRMCGGNLMMCYSPHRISIWKVLCRRVSVMYFSHGTANYTRAGSQGHHRFIAAPPNSRRRVIK